MTKLKNFLLIIVLLPIALIVLTLFGFAGITGVENWKASQKDSEVKMYADKYKQKLQQKAETTK